MSTSTEQTHTVGGFSAHPNRASNPVLEEIRKRISESPYVAMRSLHCEFHDGTLTLRGNVPTFHIRQVAHALSLKVPGVVAVDDRITVASVDSRANSLRR